MTEEKKGDQVVFTYTAKVQLPVGRTASSQLVDDLALEGRVGARQVVMKIVRRNYPGLEFKLEDEIT